MMHENWRFQQGSRSTCIHLTKEHSSLSGKVCSDEGDSWSSLIWRLALVIVIPDVWEGEIVISL